MAINDRPPVDDQPRVGEVVLHCAHVEVGTDGVHRPAKVFRVKPAVPFTRPNKSSGKATIVMICQGCWSGCRGDPTKIKLCRDSTWRSREPVVRESPDNRPRTE